MKVIDERFVFLDTSLKTKEELFQFISQELCECKRASNKDKIVEGFNKREEEFSTYIIDGIAIPHCKSDNIEKATVAIVRNTEDIEWDNDGGNANLYFCLMIPGKNACEGHIRILSTLAQTIMDNKFIQLVKEAKAAKEIVKYLEPINQLNL